MKVSKDEGVFVRVKGRWVEIDWSKPEEVGVIVKEDKEGCRTLSPAWWVAFRIVQVEGHNRLAVQLLRH